MTLRSRSALPLIAALPLLVLAFSPSLAQTPSGIAWRADYAAAQREAQEAGKPLLVVFQCPVRGKVPTLEPGESTADSALADLLRREFVPVRLTSLKGVDLNTFRFDYDLTFAALVLDPRTEAVLARYSAPGGKSPSAHVSPAGFAHTLRAAAERFHRTPPPARRTEETPAATITDLYPDFARSRRAGEPCYHCHYAADAAVAQDRARGMFAKAKLFRYPPPESVGLTLRADREDVVAAVQPGSPAAKAGVQPGDSLVSAGSAPVLSAADLQHALDPVPDPGRIALRLRRDGQEREAALSLPAGWRRSEDISWRSSQGAVPPILAIWEKELTPDEKRAIGIAPERLALRVVSLFEGEKWSEARGDFRLEDVILGAEGKPPLPAMSPRQFHAWYRLNYDVGQTATFTVLRDGKRTAVRVRCVDVGL